MAPLKKKAQKLRERAERIRREKHERRSLPRAGEIAADDPGLVPPPATPAKPSRFVAEQSLHGLHKLIGDRKFESIEEANQFLSDAMKGDPMKTLRDLPKGDREMARDLAYQAMDKDDPAEMERLARQALGHDPECVDALRMLATATATSPQERKAMMAEAVRIGERVLGAAFFEQNRGHFWGILETRPYMRARHDLATLLLRTGEVREGMGHLESLIELNTHDNQGVRYDLLPRYLEAGALTQARRLFDAYPQDYSAVFHWCRVLEQCLSGQLAGAVAALAQAREMNPYVEAYLTGRKLPPRQIPGQYSPGQPSEAACYAKDLRGAWLAHREAVSWLKERERPPRAGATGHLS
jgi:tetratricopeptide (TPR) repeat protein